MQKYRTQAPPWSVLLLLLLCLSATARKSKSKLPSCGDAAKFYADNKLYNVLGLERSATTRDIRSAFKKMSVQCHPDKDPDNPKAKDNFIAISGAYQTLSDEDSRREYDAGGRRPAAGDSVNVQDVFEKFFRGGAGAGAGGGQRSYTFSFGGGSEDEEDDGGQFESLFRGFSFGSGFGAGAGGSRQSAGGRRMPSFFPNSGMPGQPRGQPRDPTVTLMRFYHAVGVTKDARALAALARKYPGGRINQLYDKLHAKYGVDPRQFEERPSRPQAAPAPPSRQQVDQLYRRLQIFYDRVGIRKGKVELTKIADKYGAQPAPLFAKLQKKYGVSP